MSFRSLTSSSSAAAADIPPLQEKYDVFLSFRGEDTRDTFTSHLHKALLRKQIETYIDNRLERGDEIAPALIEAIEKSRIALVIFSKDYASSTWCLNELVHILGCKKRNKQIAIPIFYRIDPSDVRKQRGTYALEDRPLKRSTDEVAKWRDALVEAAKISGFHDSSKTGTEADFVEEVVQDVLIKLNRESSSDLKGLVGIEKKIEKTESLLCLDSPGVCCVGIWGMGGIGKTTLADAVFHRQWQSSKFEASCFLANVREKSEKTDGLNDLRNALFRELLEDKDVNINSPSIPPHIQYRLRRTKALIVLDDVNAREQLEVLVGDDDRFCQGSRIIITARDKGLLEQKVDPEKIYNVEGLGSDEALQLFHSHAFGNKSPTTDDTELSREVVDYVKGNPLALKVMGSLFHRCKSKQEWEAQWNKLKQFPSEEINKVLRLSYDGLEENEKEIFLDIACFHRDRNMNDVKGMLDIRGFSWSSGIKVLIDMSLISISKRNSIEMHDLLQEMGRAIVRKECIEERSSRLFSAKDVYDVLKNNKEAARVQAIFFEELNLNHADFTKLDKLRLLIVETYNFGRDKSEIFSLDLPNSLSYLHWLRYPFKSLPSNFSLDLPNSLSYLHWLRYPFKSLPSNFSPENLLVLHMPLSQVGAQLWNKGQSPVNLKEIDLGYSKHLTKVPNLSKSLKIEHIDLVGCERLVEIPSYFQHLQKLTYLRLAGCKIRIKDLQEMPCNVEWDDLSHTALGSEKYDVFLSFRGDTRDAFTNHLHKALLRNQIETYIDNRPERGDEIDPALIETIRKSKIALVLFSKDYASSTWFLKELVHILGCKKSHGQIVIPIFYRIDPSDVRIQQGTYALEDRPLKCSRDEVANWRAALEEAASMSGFHYSSKTGTEADFVEEIVQDVLTKLNRESSSDLGALFGIQMKIEKIESLLCLDSPGVCCVGIWGMGGIGKTTLADAVFHKQWQSSKFEASCFLANVREKSEKPDGLNDLRNTLVRELLKDKDVNIDTPSIPRHIQDRLRRTKALIVLDDVNARKQLEVLVGDDDRFCQGSRIIITARDKGLLEQKVDHAKIFNVEGLGSDDAFRLFHSHAFGNKSPTTYYTELSREVVDYIKGIPLALKLMGSSFRRCKSKQEWEVQWKKVKQIPNEEIDQVLRISYDGLGKNEKEIFLDIACFLRFHEGHEKKYIKELFDSRDFHGEALINHLIDRSLISISKGGWIEMHNLVQQMGRPIAREQGSRLFNAEDVYQVLTNNQGDGHVQAISFDLSEIEMLRLELEHASFKKMHQLRSLRVYNNRPVIGSLDLPNSLRYLEWSAYPLKSLPSKFSAQNLVFLSMSGSEVGGQLWNEDQSPANLKLIDLSECKHLTEVPNLSRSQKIEHIDLNGCQRLVEIPSYFQHLYKLTYLDLGQCTNLKNLPQMPCNLEFLNLSWTAIEELPSSVWSHEKISHLDIRFCRHLKSLPSNTCRLKLLGSLSLKGCNSLCEFWELPKNTSAIELFDCKSLVSLPTSIWKLKSLESLYLNGCSNFQHFSEISEAMEHLEFLNLSGTAVKELPPSIGNLVALRKLDLCDCNNLKVVPDYLFCLTSLQALNLSATKIQSIPASIKQAAQLSLLCLNNCKSLESLPELPPLLQHLEADGCTSLKIVSSSSTAITQGWEEYIFYRGLYEEHIFSDCPRLDQNARSNIMADAQLRIMRIATASSKFKEDKIEEASYDSDDFDEESFVGIRCSGNEIPNWFSHKSEGCSIKIELPRDWFSTDFLGFALSLVVAGKGYAPVYMQIGCKYNFKTNNGESHEVNHLLPKNVFASSDSLEVVVWWYNNEFEVVEGARSPTAFYKLVTEVNVDFTVRSHYDHESDSEEEEEEEVEVEKCGICLLYGKDAEMIKQRALYAQDS